MALRDNVKVIAYWHVDGKTVSDEVMVTSEVVESSEENLLFPGGHSWGIGSRNGTYFLLLE